jgi:Spy/CpxP family protein refolding chaperone
MGSHKGLGYSSPPIFCGLKRFVGDPMKQVFALAVLIASSAAFAADVASEEPVSPADSVAINRSAEAAVKMLTKRLSLTADQQAKILPIIVERRRKVREVWNSSEQLARQKQVQLRGIYLESDKRINALLTGEQQKAYAKLEEERKLNRRYPQSQSDSSS